MIQLTKRRMGILFTLMMLLNSMHLFANEGDNTGSINGKITTSDNKPAAYVTIVLKGTNKKTLSDDDGSFSINKLQAGTYQLEISFVGYKTIEQNVVVEPGKTSTINIQLTVTEKQLDEVIVSSGSNKFSKRNSAYVARLPLKNLENPQAYTTISSALLKEQVITNFDDALKNAPGIDKLWTSTGRANDGAAYFSLRGFSTQPTMINGVAGLTNGGLDPANIEKIEVIKGPSSTLFGSSLISFGGLTNIVTKKPYDTLGGEISYMGGSFGLSRMTADINTPINKDKNILFRLNTAYHYENSFQDAGFKKTFYVAPSISYKVNDKLSFLLNTEFYNAETTNPLMLFLNRTRKLVAVTPQQLNVKYSRSFTSNDVTIKTPTVNLYGQINYKMSSNWVSQTNLSRSIRNSDGYYQYVMYILPGDTLLHRYISNQNSTSITSDIQQNFIGDFNIGKMRNRMVVGMDVLAVETRNASSAYITFDTVNATKPDTKYTNLTKAALDAKFAGNTSPTKTNVAQYTYSAYVSDVLNITDRLLAMASLRVDRFDNRGTYTLRTDATTGAYAQTAFSPKFGAVYQVVKNKVSIFANYMNGFKNVAAVTQLDGTVSNFKPQQANQVEAGIKAETFEGKLTATLSYYDIYVKDITRPDPLKVGYTIQDGNQSSKGIELDVIASPLPGLNIVAGYSHNKSLNEKTDTVTIGRRPNSAGPETLVNGWISYNVPQGKLKGWGIGFGGNYASENLITNSSIAGVFTIPAYTVLNASIFYNAKAFRLVMKMDNVGNKEYWKGWSTVEPQKPRTVVASVAFKF